SAALPQSVAMCHKQTHALQQTARYSITKSASAISVKSGRRIQTGPAVEHGVDTEARVIIEELGRPPLGVDASLPRLPDNIPDGLQTLIRGKVSWRILVRTPP